MAGFQGNEGARAAVARVWDAIGVYVLVLLVPLLLIGVGRWELGRADQAHDDYATAARELPPIREEIRALAERQPMAMVQAGQDRTLPASMAVAELDEIVPMAERGAFLSSVRRPFAIAAMAGGGLMLAAGLIGLLVAAQAGRAARASRDQLVLSFSRVHRALPFILGGLLVGLAVALIGIAVFETISLWFWDRVSTGAFKLILVGLMFAGLAVYGAFVAIRGLGQVFALAAPEPFDAEGRRVDEAAAPGLWRFVRDIAGRQGAVAPDAIVLGLQGGFYVTEHPVRLLPEGEVLAGRTLHLPAPYLELLDEEELAGVIAHELAHFVGEDTSYSRHFTPIYTGLERALVAMAEASGGSRIHPAFQLGLHTMDSFDHAVKHWGRLREFEADRMSSAVGGPRPIASALLRTSVIAPMVDDTLERGFQAPAEGEADLVGDVAAAVRSQGWPEMREHLDRRAAHPTDTHPSTPHRIETLNVPLDAALVSHATRPPADPADTPGSRLFADWLETRRRLSADFTANARRAHAEHRAYLEGAVAAVVEDVRVYERTGPMMWLMGIFAALFAAALVANFVFFSDDLSFALILGTVLLVAAAGFGLFAAFLRRRGREPLMELTADALATHRLKAPLRWLDVDGFGVSVGSKLELALAIAEGAPLPERRHYSPRTAISRRKRLVTLQCYGVRDMKPQDFSDLIGRFMEAARAREALRG